jgi:endonuclease YncB( thermonuclease family)
MALRYLVILLISLGMPVSASEVLSVGDGDTITVTEGSRRIKVRLACIDAPETSQSPYGMEARKKLQGLLPIGAQVTLKTKATDRYGRSVAEVFKGSANINQSLVGSGNAFVYWQYISGCDRQTYTRLEGDARLKRLGVWSVPSGIQRPWEYRHNKRGHHTNSGSGVSNGSQESSRHYYCKDLTYQQAQVLLKQGHTYLDRDGDGEACESKKEKM